MCKNTCKSSKYMQIASNSNGSVRSHGRPYPFLPPSLPPSLPSVPPSPPRPSKKVAWARASWQGAANRTQSLRWQHAACIPGGWGWCRSEAQHAHDDVQYQNSEDANGLHHGPRHDDDLRSSARRRKGPHCNTDFCIRTLARL